MARRVSRKSQEIILMHKWWVRALIAVAFLGLAYGFASLAIDSGSLLEYAVTIAFLWWAVHHALRAARFAFR
ncbi:hypothetical protein KW794_03140 [Candidatus Saccharibacteria bacterium]|nr:hypothetical protein [Candidatus Saccharibacteria bacterium]